MSTSQLQAGDLLMGKYRIDKRLGAGAMGVVYAATHTQLRQRVAIKVMRPSAADKEQLERFLREARASVGLKTQHVARVLDVGTTDDGAPYMVMEHLDGRDLAAELRDRGPMSIAEAVCHVLQVCEGVAEAHATGIVHRDIKPANLFLTTSADGEPCVKVLDFGISKFTDEAVSLTGEQHALGSPLYMSPEQMKASKDVDSRSDIWALGVTLYELVAGKTPFHGDLIAVVCTRVFQEPPVPLTTYRSDAPAGFEAVIMQCLDKDRERRFPSVAALAAALVPFGPPLAALSAERVAKVLGEQVAPSRPTDVLPPEPTATASPAATGVAVVRSTRSDAAERPRSRWHVVAAALGALTVGGVAAAAIGLRGGSAPAPAGAGTAVMTTSAVVVETAKPLETAKPAMEIDAGPVVEPTATASATALASSSAPTPRRRPAGPKAAPQPAPVSAPPPLKPAAPKATNTIYDR